MDITGNCVSKLLRYRRGGPLPRCTFDEGEGTIKHNIEEFIGEQSVTHYLGRFFLMT